MMSKSSWVGRGAVMAAVVATGLAFASPASAEVRTGWIGSTPPVGGQLYLHTSTIDNAGVPKASTRIYTAFGGTVAQGTMAAKARLFQEGALCAATDYQFNLFFTNSQNVTVQKDCGPGFYNSHGFVGVQPPGAAFGEYITFPSDPLQYPPAAAAARQAPPASGTNADGLTYGSAADITDESQLPDLVSAIGANGETGYIAGDELSTDEAQTSSRSVPLVAEDGKTVVGEFVIGEG